ncbi:hypothetical protein DEU56DRAFT_788307 [Suillus clintonianus]|uniref:uncharacterized protein n=1 Tax=Suillus clintonianus TaxID=1904413 RepID=UPI001B85CF04|nr:uncharacterized protein DEU56DRAFT_788307 [Suillus clintonianus]KAG2145831.1 hypothetical protein DEU56DRAFT_788307 [Suillus clintonianus]
MLKEAGLEDLLLPIPNVPCRKSFIDVRQLRHTLTPSFANPRALLRRFSSLFRCAQSNTDGVTELQQLPRQSIFSCCSSIVERSAVLDIKVRHPLGMRYPSPCSTISFPPLAVAPQLKREHLHTRPAGISTTTPGATTAESQLLRLLAHLMLSPYPSPTSDTNTAVTARPIARPSPVPGIISACRCLDIRDTSCSCC